jgi:putative ABC transport system permease protein
VSFIASWRTALRIARREVRRAKLRSILVVAMIALPVLFLAFAAVSYDMFTLTGAEKADRTMGTGTARIQWTSKQGVLQLPDPDDGYYSDPSFGSPAGPDADKPPTQAELIAALPAGSTVLPVLRGVAAIKVPDGVARPNAVSIDASTPMTNGYVTLLSGHVPGPAGEVALTEQAMTRLGVSLGGRVTLADSDDSYTVVGQVEFPSLLEDVVLFPALPDPVPRGIEINEASWLVHTPAPITWSDVQHYNRLGMLITSRDVLENPPPADQVPNPFGPHNTVDPEQLSIGVLVAGLALLEIVLMAGPAFAVSARRRQRQLALVAANGGTPAHVRRIVLADGVVLGVVGAAIGIVLGIAAGFGARPLIETGLAHFRAGGYRIFPLALVAIVALAVVTGVLAAVVPAFITARQNIISSLAGRRGVTRSRKRWLVLGLVMVAIGSAVVMYGASDVDATVMLVGLILGELGLVLCTPTLVGLIAGVGRILPVAPRIALRDAARNRAAASPAISAVMAAVAGSVAIGLIFVSVRTLEQKEYHAFLPTGYAEVFLPKGGATATEQAAAVEQLSGVLRSTLPVTETHPVSRIVCASGAPDTTFCDLRAVAPPEKLCPYAALVSQRQLTPDEVRAARADPRCQGDLQGTLAPLVIDGSALATVTGASGTDLQRGVETLQAGGVVVLDSSYLKDGKVSLAVVNQDNLKPNSGDPVTNAPRVELPGYLLSTATVSSEMIIGSPTVSRLGLASTTYAVVAATSRMPTQTEEDRLNGHVAPLGTVGMVEHGPPTTTDVRMWLLMAAAAAITLAAAGVGTGLAAADGRQDLSTLAAVGASPRLRRGLSLSQSGVIAGLGSILGAGAGIGAAIAIMVALNQRYVDIWPGPAPYPIVLPWLSLLIALLVVPLIAMLGAGSLTRSRLPIERRI